MVSVTQAWQRDHPGAAVGLLALTSASNPRSHPRLEEQKAALEAAFRRRFADRAAIKALPTCQAYSVYYKRFKKTYIVQHQLETIALRGRSLPRVSALVDAMFMAELKNQLLTAGHDLDKLTPPIAIDSARGGEVYVALNGKEQTIKAGDMFLIDAQGPVNCVVYGPDSKTAIGPETKRVLYITYTPAGIDPAAVEEHLGDIEANVRIASPEVRVELREVITAG